MRESVMHGDATTQPITEAELHPSNWEVTTIDTDCGRPCTPHGCMGHPSDIPDAIYIGKYAFGFVDDLTDSVDHENAIRVRKKLEEVFQFYADNHPL